jgi:hypothetical protein
MEPFDFPEPVDLGQGRAWTARLTLHDVYRHMMFIFELTLWRDGVRLERLTPVYITDHDYSFPECTLSVAEIRDRVRRDLHDAALRRLRERDAAG